MKYAVSESDEFLDGAGGKARARADIERRIRAGGPIRGEGILGAMGFLDVPAAASLALSCLGLDKRAEAEADLLEVTEHTVHMGRLPEQFDGLRVLHLSDLHCAADRGIPRKLEKALSGVEYHLAVLTGDFQDNLRKCESEIIRDDMARVRDILGCPAFFTLGNHDHLEVAEVLSSVGYVGLVNRHAEISRGGGKIFVGGVDDPHFYRTHLTEMVREISGRGCTILLSHSPDICHCCRPAVLGAPDLVLCGHTHGGQVCLPGGFALVNNSRCARWATRGAWQLGATRGYTSRGVGTSGIKARLNCPPEAVVHVLRKKRRRGLRGGGVRA